MNNNNKKKLFSSSSLSAIKVVSSAYLRLLIFLPAILIPACASSSPAFRMWWKESEVAQLCPTLCDPMDYSLPGSSIHGTFQARVLEWVAISFSRGSSRPRDWTHVSRFAGRHFTVWATKEVTMWEPWAYISSIIRGQWLRRKGQLGLGWDSPGSGLIKFAILNLSKLNLIKFVNIQE